MVKNAIKFTRKGLISLEISYDKVNSRLIIHVCDTGTGIAEDEFCKLFNRFGKLHRTAEMNHEGIGLGLTIVKQIVELSGGTIIAESAGVNKGSTFILDMIMPTPVNLSSKQTKLLAVNSELGSDQLVSPVPKSSHQ